MRFPGLLLSNNTIMVALAQQLAVHHGGSGTAVCCSFNEPTPNSTIMVRSADAHLQTQTSQLLAKRVTFNYRRTAKRFIAKMTGNDWGTREEGACKWSCP
jgi:hypothetical protein